MSPKVAFAKKLLRLNDFQLEKLRFLYREDRQVLYRQPSAHLSALLLSHALEKGMSLDDRREFGADKAHELLTLLEQPTFTPGTYEYNVSMSILSDYIEHYAASSAKNSLAPRFTQLVHRKPYQTLPAGAYDLPSTEIQSSLHYEQALAFLNSRHDIRRTSNRTISHKLMQQIIQTASLAPSACNRQPWHFYYSLNPAQNRRLGALVGGNKAFADKMKYYGAVTIDQSLFSSRPDEFRQGYLNAGIFVAYLALAMHLHGIGSCIMQFTGFVGQDEPQARSLLQLPNSEQIMAIFGFGHYPKTVRCSYAARRSPDDILRQF